MVHRRKLLIGAAAFLALIVLVVGGWIAIGIASIAGVATPEYQIVSRHDGYEIRQYRPQIAAEVDVDGEFEDSLNRGFRKLAAYIFGENTSPDSDRAGDSRGIAMTAPVLEQATTSASIAMTSPVLEVEAMGEKHTVTFIMPEEYTLATIPRPKDPAVRLVEVPARKYAVLRFSGWVDGEKSDRMKARLLDSLVNDGITATGPAILAQYNPPWTPPFMRRNEILVPLS